jgi:hypothetical protein
MVTVFLDDASLTVGSRSHLIRYLFGSGNATTVTTRDRNNGHLKTETFFGALPTIRKD